MSAKRRDFEDGFRGSPPVLCKKVVIQVKLCLGTRGYLYRQAKEEKATLFLSCKLRVM